MLKLKLILVPFYMPVINSFKSKFYNFNLSLPFVLEIGKDMDRDFQFTKNLAIVDRVLKVRKLTKALKTYR